MKTLGDVLEATIPVATQSVLNNHGVHIVGDSNRVAVYSVVAVIGFSRDDFGGALGFAAEGNIVKAAYAEHNSVLSDSWVGEISNQLVGRLKSGLLSYGVVIRLAIPMVLHGLDIQVRQSETKLIHYPCDSEHGGRACGWMQIGTSTKKCNWRARKNSRKPKANWCSFRGAHTYFNQSRKKA
jgi:CheY-specific phosphatase CheX